ncbi:MAG: tRNA lysidine(34) synthetase TilS, partial [Vibrionaceae bacterium]|nr:tRNA lysidine(34) synthetase TilS [Vibrionaceae bacterium]
MTLYQTFSTIIDRYYAPNTRIVLAFSGGVDSRVLLDLLTQYHKEKQVDCLAVYVHHGLSSNADDWLARCQMWATQSGIDFIAEHVQLNANGESLEACAREARYQALRQHLNANDLLLTGQHSDDQLETFLLALKRGSGPKGLSAMGEATALGEATIVRPLLSVSRAQIEHYAQQQGLEWVEDESNQDTRFDRNFIRHQISPLLTQRWPHFAQSVNRSAQ